MPFGVFSYEVYERSWLMQAGDTGNPEVNASTWIIPRLTRVPPHSLVGTSGREGASVLLMYGGLWNGFASKSS